MYDELFTRVKHLLTNRLHGKAAEHIAINSLNNSVTATKYMSSARVTLYQAHVGVAIMNRRIVYTCTSAC